VTEYGAFAREIFGRGSRAGLVQGWVTEFDWPTSTYTVALDSAVGAPSAGGIKSMVPCTPGDAVWMSTTASGELVIVSQIETGWRYVGNAGEPSFANSWSNFGGGYRVARFCKVGGEVIVNGLITGGAAGQAAWIMPTGYRPAAQMLMMGWAGSGVARIDVLTDGQVQPGVQYAATGGNQYVSLNLIRYVAEQ
jgi:hypothetical protein